MAPVNWKQGDQEVTLSFTDASGKPVDVGAVSLNFHMPQMGGMAAMNDAVTFTTTSTPGVYRGKVNLGSGGERQAQLAFEGPAGNGKTTFSVTRAMIHRLIELQPAQPRPGARDLI